MTRFSFIVYGDTRGRQDGVALQYEHSLVVDSAIAEIKRLHDTPYPARFVLQSGDAVVNGRDAHQWNTSFIPLINRLTSEGGVRRNGVLVIRGFAEVGSPFPIFGDGMKSQFFLSPRTGVINLNSDTSSQDDPTVPSRSISGPENRWAACITPWRIVAFSVVHCGFAETRATTRRFMFGVSWRDRPASILLLVFQDSPSAFRFPT